MREVHTKVPTRAATKIGEADPSDHHLSDHVVRNRLNIWGLLRLNPDFVSYHKFSLFLTYISERLGDLPPVAWTDTPVCVMFSAG